MFNTQEELVNKKETVEEFLAGFEIDCKNMTEKQKLKLLHDMVVKCKATRDLVEFDYDNNKTTKSADEFLKEIHEIEITEMRTQYFIGKQYVLYKEQKKAKRKERVRKIKSLFTKR